MCKVADRDVGLGGANEILQRGIDERGLRVHVEQRRSGAFEAERKTVGPANAGARVQLRNVAVAQFAIAGGGVLLVGGRDADAGGMFQREFDGVVEGDAARRAGKRAGIKELPARV